MLTSAVLQELYFDFVPASSVTSDPLLLREPVLMQAGAAKADDDRDDLNATGVLNMSMNLSHDAE